MVTSTLGVIRCHGVPLFHLKKTCIAHTLSLQNRVNQHVHPFQSAIFGIYLPGYFVLLDKPMHIIYACRPRHIDLSDLIE
jgi:hypothetical protein